MPLPHLFPSGHEMAIHYMLLSTLGNLLLIQMPFQDTYLVCYRYCTVELRKGALRGIGVTLLDFIIESICRLVHFIYCPWDRPVTWQAMHHSGPTNMSDVLRCG